MFRILLAAIVLAGAPAAAAAQGYCVSKEKRVNEADRLEDIAKAAGSHEPSGSLLWCVLHGPDENVEMGRPPDPKVTAAFRMRALTACTVIAARTPTTPVGIVDACTDFLAGEGTKKLGGVDLVARIFARPRGWSDEPTLHTIAVTKDARARTAILDAVRAALAAGKKLDAGTVGAWTAYRVDALAALELVGAKADLPLVDDIVATVKGRANIAGQKEDDFIHPAAKKARAAMATR